MKGTVMTQSYLACASTGEDALEQGTAAAMQMMLTEQSTTWSCSALMVEINLYIYISTLVKSFFHPSQSALVIDASQSHLSPS